jgi:hypothetical protein
MESIRSAFVKRAPALAPAPEPTQPPPKITFVYITCRKNPRLEWFLDSLYNQARDISNIQIVIVDFHLQYDEDRRKYVNNIVKGRFDFVHVPPKPSPWQGPHRLTKMDCFAASSSRNTGVCYVKHPYIVFVDDLSVMAPGSFSHIVQYAKESKVVAFSYAKVFELAVHNGSITGMREHAAGIDSRNYIQGSLTHVSGSQFYGYASISLNTLLKVNGYDDISSSHGYEDLDCGIRLEKLGESIYYSKDVKFYETEDISNEVCFHRRDPLLSDEKYTELLKQFNIDIRWDPKGRFDISHLLVDKLTRNKTWTDGNDYNLAELRKTIQNGGSFPSSFDPDMKTIEGIFLRDL